MKKYVIGIIAVVLTWSLCFVILSTAQENRTEEGVGLTIYSAPFQGAGNQAYTQQYVDGRYVQVPNGYAIVKEWRKLNLKQGENILKFQDVAKFIEPSTVNFKSLTDPLGTYVVEQNYEYDLVSRDKLLERYIDREIFLERTKDNKTERQKGILVSAQNGIVVKVGDEIQLNPLGEIILPELPEGLITRPTLVWLIDAAKGGTHLTKVTYETKGIMWMADYTAVVKNNDSAVDLSGWVSIDNRSGATYKNSQLKLVAGDVNRVTVPAQMYKAMRAELAVDEAAGSRGFEEKSFFEYHLYTLGRPSTLDDNSQKQIELFKSAMDVPAKKIMVYYGRPEGGYYYSDSPQMDRNLGSSTNKKIDIYITFKNDKNSGLAIPLPAGKVRVYKEDPADGSLEFIGEDKIDHTPKDEEVMLKLGSAFDVVGERKQTDFKVDYDRHWMSESFEITLRNHKEEDVEVIVKENLFRWVNWKITNNSYKYEKVDARTIHFPVKVPKGQEVKVNYTANYTW
jgi:hypothetical protein